MKIPESRYAKTGDVKDHNTFDMDALKQYGRDLLAAAAVNIEDSAFRSGGACTDIGEEFFKAADAIRKLQETL
jgi:hypothetical protein